MKLSTNVSIMTIMALAGLGAMGAAGLACEAETQNVPAKAAPAANEAPAPTSDVCTIDAAHSSVIYRIKHMDASYNYGRFNDLSGTFHLNAAKPEASVLNVTVKTASVDTANKDRDEHLRSPDFFDAKQFPTMSFVAKSFKKTGEHTYEATGDATLLGKTRPLTVTVEHSGAGKGRGGETLMGLETRFTIKRSEFGMGKMVGPIADEVTMIVSLEGLH